MSLALFDPAEVDVILPFLTTVFGPVLSDDVVIQLLYAWRRRIRLGLHLGFRLGTLILIFMAVSVLAPTVSGFRIDVYAGSVRIGSAIRAHIGFVHGLLSPPRQLGRRPLLSSVE